ncbi:MAG: hypothetical protein U9P90_01120 [Patescibacteria group bacterium]|nr:hypothetical protein [Patescibacteria group bacterium]
MKEKIKKSLFSLGILFIGITLVIAVNIIFIPKQEIIMQPAGLDTFGNEQNLGRNDNFVAYKLEGWNSAWVTQPEFDGDDMPIDALVDVNNIDLDVKKSIAPRLGSEILGTQSSESNPIKSLHTSKSLDGRELLVRTHSTVIEWWNPDNTAWEAMSTSTTYTSGQDFSMIDGMTSSETAMYTYLTNGNESMRRFRVGFGSVASSTTATATLNSVAGHDSVDDIGFNTTGSITINGTDYAYTLINGWDIGGFSNLPSIAANTGIISAIETTGFTDPPGTSTALLIKDQRLYAASENSVFCSKIDDFRDFSFASPRVASEGEIIIFPEGGNKITGLGMRPDYVAVFKKDYIGKLQFKDYGENLSDIPVVNHVAREINVGAVNQKSIVQKNFSVVFSNNEIGMSELTRLEYKDFDEAISLTERIRPSIVDYTLTDSVVGIIGNRILHAARDNSSFNNVIIVYDFARDRFTKFTGWNADSFTVYNNELYYGDSLNQNVYKIFDSEYDDNDLPYITEWKTKWVNFGYPDRWKEIERVYVEGFINKETSIDFTIYLDEGGDLTSKIVTIAGSGDYVAVNPSKGFGTNPFGLINFSNVKDSESNLLHFSGYILLDDLFDNKFRNIQFGGTTSGTGQNYRISRIIPYINVLEVNYAIEYSESVIND